MSPSARHQFVLSEEVVRWAFEVHVQGNDTARANWRLIFSNPTAGPWKRLMVPDKTGAAVEVLRFGREEDRPDLVLVSDALKLILIVEAKDSIGKLVDSAQMKKTVQVIKTLAERLSKSTVPAWQPRRDYRALTGFIWPDSGTRDDFTRLTAAFDKESEAEPFIGIVAMRAPGGLA